ncbi:MAG: hypothetical protein QOF81_2485 [Acidimicrobiaceae bacterium]|nr:hypothetical protein [Acidimicrobiaceae bacterium]
MRRGEFGRAVRPAQPARPVRRPSARSGRCAPVHHPAGNRSIPVLPGGRRREPGSVASHERVGRRDADTRNGERAIRRPPKGHRSDRRRRRGWLRLVRAGAPPPTPCRRVPAGAGGFPPRADSRNPRLERGNPRPATRGPGAGGQNQVPVRRGGAGTPAQPRGQVRPCAPPHRRLQARRERERARPGVPPHGRLQARRERARRERPGAPPHGRLQARRERERERARRERDRARRERARRARPGAPPHRRLQPRRERERPGAPPRGLLQARRGRERARRERAWRERALAPRHQ